MEIGQKVSCTPLTLAADPHYKKLEKKTGRIVYIHPRGRYVAVEFTTRDGQKLRESFAPDEITVLK